MGNTQTTERCDLCTRTHRQDYMTTDITTDKYNKLCLECDAVMISTPEYKEKVKELIDLGRQHQKKVDDFLREAEMKF